MSKECLNGSEMSRVLKALDIANKRIDQLEKYNLDLANESHNKSMAIDRANERVEGLELVNLELAANVEACCELTEMDMGAAIERLFEIDNTESKALLNKFAIDKKIEGYIRGFVSGYQQAPDDIESGNWTGDIDDLTAYASDFSEQLRKEQE